MDSRRRLQPASASGIWLGTISKVVPGGYLVEVPRLARARIFGSAAHPITYPTAFFGGQLTITAVDSGGDTVTIHPAPLTLGQHVLVGFFEGDPDQLVIIRPA